MRLAVRAVLACVALLAASAPAEAKKLKVGDMAPDFTMTLIDGSKVSLAELRGKVVLLNYWATWCVPCKTELPTLDRYYEMQKKFGLRMFAVTTEDSLQPYQLKKLFAVMHIAPVRKVKGEYGDVAALPTNYVIDRAGRLRYAKAGAFDLDSLNATLVPLLKEEPPAGTSAE